MPPHRDALGTIISILLKLMQTDPARNRFILLLTNGDVGSILTPQ